MMHFNRTVIHPDFCGFGLGIRLINETSRLMAEQGFVVCGKFSSLPVYKSLTRDPHWRLMDVRLDTPSGSGTMQRGSGFRKKVKTWSFKYVGNRN